MGSAGSIKAMHVTQRAHNKLCHFKSCLGYHHQQQRRQQQQQLCFSAPDLHPRPWLLPGGLVVLVSTGLSSTQRYIELLNIAIFASNAFGALATVLGLRHRGLQICPRAV